MRTPWGQAQQIEDLAPGIKWVSTASHGGVKLDRALNAEVPDYMREPDGWYEEDVDWAVVAVVYPDAFEPGSRERAKDTLRNWRPGAYEAFFGEVIQPGMSHVKDERIFLSQHRDDYLVVSAVGDWKEGVPKGFVLVSAARGGRSPEGRLPKDMAEFLVPQEEYDVRTPFGFVVDESRHQRVA